MPHNWSKSGERPFLDPYLVREAEEQFKTIHEHLLTTQSCQKSYVNHRWCELFFNLGDYVYLKVAPHKGAQRFQVKGKLTPCYVRPFQVIAKRGAVGYKLELSPSFSNIHNVFQISQSNKCL